MTSVLPESLETKRKLVSKQYLKSILGLAGGVYLALLLCAVLLLYLPSSVSARFAKGSVLGILVLIVLPAEAYGIYRFAKQSDELCRRLDFLCPHCGQPLFQPRGHVHLTGRCPKCNHGLTAATIRQDERVRLSKLPPSVEPEAVAVEKMLAVGTRVRFLTLVVLNEQSQSPPFIYAEPGECGLVGGYATRECYWVVADGRPETFPAWPDEFEPV